MSENLKTIKELADELGVSKQTIRNKIDKDFREKFVQTIKIKGNNTLVRQYPIRQEFPPSYDTK